MTDDLKFQIIDWDDFHDDDMSGNKVYKIRLFGKTKEDKNVYLQIEDFSPFFFVEIDSNWRDSSIQYIIDACKKRVFPKENVDGLKSFKVVEKYKFDGFTNYKKFKYLQLTFKSHIAMKSYDRAFSKKLKVPQLSRRPIKLRIYESNIQPFIRFMHIRQLSSVGWVSVKKNNLMDFDIAPTTAHYNYKCRWTDVDKVDDNDIRKLVIASFDIECTSEDGTFPKPKRDGDKVIQIGITYSRFGETECYEKRILTLNKTTSLPDAIVEWFPTEEELLLAFSRTIRETDPDIVTGYNIFGFDFKYLMKRSQKLDIFTKFSRLSRVKGEVCQFVKQELSSSALGDNKLRYYKMTGRVIVDLMKVVQRDFKLPSYKLDSVASNFIKDIVADIEVNEDNNTTVIKTKSVKGLTVGNYVTLCYFDGITDNLYQDGQKFQIKQLDQEAITIKGKLDKNELFGPNKKYKVWWCQAKDDIKPSDIFRLQEGSPDDRALIAKYCVQDCALCNRIISKLQVLANNIGMAIVCNVPLSYLFLRGQGVKIFSLVSKKCREREHLIPVLKKKNPKNVNEKDKQNADNIEKAANAIVRHMNRWNDDEDDEEEEENVGYEGATVFPPEKAVHFEPIPVLDFSSLYPNAMRLRNLSHEMHVTDSNYDNLPGYRYHVITYRNNDDTYTTCRFAENLDGTKGILPEILQELLDARKKYKDLMDAEKDPFKKAIWDGLQLAYKITANSLYGQTGAPTSPIYRKEIAASTTATGREMLQFSKHFIEDIYQTLIKLALTNKKKYDNLFNEVYTYYPTNITMSDGTKLHVCTDEKSVIPEKKFVVKEKDEFLCKNKDEMREKFYEIINTLLKGMNLDLKTIYGDSVTGDTPIIIKRNNKLEIHAIEDLGKEWISYDAFKPNVKGLMNKQQYNNIDFEVWSGTKWTKVNRVIRHKTTKKIYEILTHTGYIKVTEDHSLLKYDGTIITPTECHIGTRLLTSVPNIANYELKTEVTTNRMIIDQVKFLQTNNKYGDGYIKQITCMGYINDYVYDLETEEGRFHAGVGDIIVKNTDSVFFKTIITKDGIILKDKKALEITIQLGVWGSILITALLPPPMAQAYEKVMYPLIILTKKRYVGNLYERDPNKFYQKCMGIVLKRRDNAQIVKIVCGNIIDQILNKNSADGAVKMTREILKKIITGKYKMDRFVVTKTLRGTYSGLKKTPERNDRGKIIHTIGEKGVWGWDDVDCALAHVALAQRLGQRDPGNKPECNDRIPYVYIETKKEVKLQGERIETPDYVNENDLKLDYLFYITNQIMKPATQFLELIVENPDKIFDEYIIKEENRKKGMMPIEYYTRHNATEHVVAFDTFIKETITKEKLPEEVPKKKIKKQNKKPSPKSVPIDGDTFILFE